MIKEPTQFPLAGRTFKVDYGDLVATNSYAKDKAVLSYEIISGPLTGAAAEVGFEWSELDGGNLAISWQESDGSTVVHIDNLQKGLSLSFFTTPTGEFYRLSGTFQEVSAI